MNLPPSTPMQMGSYQPPPPGGYQQPPPQQQYQPSGMAPNVAALLCYAFGIISGILFLVLEPYSKDRLIRFHAWQSIFVFGAVFALQIGITIVTIIVSQISSTLATLVGLMSLVVSLGTLVLWVLLMVKAYQGQRWVLPVIGPMAEQKA